jgi:hypothetical protein
LNYRSACSLSCPAPATPDSAFAQESKARVKRIETREDSAIIFDMQISHDRETREEFDTETCVVCGREFLCEYECTGSEGTKDEPDEIERRPHHRHELPHTDNVICGSGKCRAKAMQRRNRARYHTYSSPIMQAMSNALRLAERGRLQADAAKQTYGSIPRKLRRMVDTTQQEIAAAYHAADLLRLEKAWKKWDAASRECSLARNKKAWFADCCSWLLCTLSYEDFPDSLPEVVKGALGALVNYLEPLARGGICGPFLVNAAKRGVTLDMMGHSADGISSSDGTDTDPSPIPPLPSLPGTSSLEMDPTDRRRPPP